MENGMKQVLNRGGGERINAGKRRNEGRGWIRIKYYTENMECVVQSKSIWHNDMNEYGIDKFKVIWCCLWKYSIDCNVTTENDTEYST